MALLSNSGARHRRQSSKAKLNMNGVNGVADKANSKSPPPPERARRSAQPNGKAVVPLPESKIWKRIVEEWELPRKTLHSSIGAFSRLNMIFLCLRRGKTAIGFMSLYLYMGPGNARAVVAGCVGALTIIAPVDYLRLNHSGFEKFYESVLGFLMRDSEKASRVATDTVFTGTF
jgi:diacylglycerol kinase (CTP)